MITNFDQAHKELSKFIPKPYKTSSYSLDRMLKLMSSLGNPQEEYKAIHIAGTSGKTSTCYYVAALLKQAGQKVGLTVSPHVDEVNERVQINLIPLNEEDFCKELTEFLQIIEQTNLKPTYFELLVAFAYWTFAKQKVDYAVVEVGLGGLLDGTNVTRRQDKICVITDIGLDHTEVLGKTLSEIATQKAGIIKDHNRVVMYEQDTEVMKSVRERCAQVHASLQTIDTANKQSLPKGLPPFQQRNWFLAKTTAEYVYDRDSLNQPGWLETEKALHTIIPARMEAVNYQGKTIIIDGSHNGQKMAALTEGISSLYPNQPVAVLVSFVASEAGRASEALKRLSKVTGKLIITSFSGEQDTPKHSIDPHRIETAAKGLGFKDIKVIQDPKQAFQQLLNQSEDLLVVTGSFYLLNHIRPLILK